MESTLKQKKLATAGLVTFKLGYSIAMVGFGSLLGVMAKDLDFDRSLGGQPLGGFAVGFLGGILFMVLKVFEPLRRDFFRLTALSAVVMALVAIGWGFSQSLGTLVGLWVLLGISGVAHEVGSNALMTRLYPKTIVGALVFYHMTWNVGAFFGPLVFGVLVGSGMSWRIVPGISFCLLSIGAILLWISRSKTGEVGVDQKAETKSVVPFQPPWFLGALLSCYTCTEMTLNSWAPSALQNRFDLSDAKTASIISGFWGLMGVSRLCAGLLSKRYRAESALVLCTGLALITQSVLAFSQDYHWAKGALWMTGLTLSSSVSWLLALALQKQPEHVEKTSVFLMVMSGIGLFLGPPAAGFASSKWSFDVVLYGSMAINALLFLGVFKARFLKGK